MPRLGGSWQRVLDASIFARVREIKRKPKPKATTKGLPRCKCFRNLGSYVGRFRTMRNHAPILRPKPDKQNILERLHKP